MLMISVSVEWHYFVFICFKTDLLSEFDNTTILGGLSVRTGGLESTRLNYLLIRFYQSVV